jgi:DegV family protein with EDD domain
MGKIAVITDTDSSLPPALAAQLGILQVPITIHFDDSNFTTGLDIDDRSLFEKIDRINKLPTTSAPAPSAFADAFTAAFNAGAESVICICVSSKVSATYNAALSACEQFPGQDVTVIDSMNLSMAQGFIVLAAAEAARRGATKAEILETIHQMDGRLHVYAALSTLKYLALSGRVGKLVAGIADTFNVKPILSVREGKLDLLERIRTRKKAWERILELTCSAAGTKSIARAAIIHVNNPEGAKELEGRLRAVLACPDEIIIAEFTPGLSVHAGSGVVGVVILTNP